jgi:hypothetical protein
MSYHVISDICIHQMNFIAFCEKLHKSLTTLHINLMLKISILTHIRDSDGDNNRNNNNNRNNKHMKKKNEEKLP